MNKDIDRSEFELKVDRCRKSNSPELISNAAWSHAVYLFKNLLEVAADKNEDVRLVTGSLNDSFYSELEEPLNKCINAGVNIEVVVLDGNAELDGNIFASVINGYQHGYLDQTPEGYSLGAAHMLLIGKNAARFRLETDHEQTKAVASFNNPEMGKTLLTVFADIKSTIRNSKNPVALAAG